jgi:S-DNA-T family DNA segregation ATPase FtsK/SpoIIIE
MEAANALSRGPATPVRVELAEALGLPADVERQVLEDWIRDRSGAAARSLTATCGVGAGGSPVAVDLRSPAHLLIGGASGSGKSELLRFLAVGLAVRRSPRTLKLAMVDPDGALEACARLPHVISRVTALRAGAGREVLAWLGKEMSWRQEVLRWAGTGDLEEMERTRPDRAPARLVVLVDEVLELVAAAPDAVEELVAIGREGGRLGIHLALATAHARELTGALAALAGSQVAMGRGGEWEREAPVGTGEAGLPPGRGSLRTGPGPLVEFQAPAASGEPLARVIGAVVKVNERLV